MIGLLKSLLKIFVAIALVSVFTKWWITYMGIQNLGIQWSSSDLPGWILFITAGTSGFICFIVGMTIGLIWGEENASKRYNELWHRFYKNQ